MRDNPNAAFVLLASLVAGLVSAGVLMIGNEGGTPPRVAGLERGHPPATTVTSAPPIQRAGSLPVASIPRLAQTPADVRLVVDAMRSAGGADVTALRALALDAPDPLVCGNAIRALGRLRAIDLGDPALVAFLDDPRLRVRQEFVRALGANADPNATELLAGVLDRDDPTLRTSAIRALGGVGGERARALLTAVRDDRAASDADRVFARSALRATPATERIHARRAVNDK